MVTFIRRFKEGDKIPDGAKFLSTEEKYERTGRTIVTGPRGIIDMLVFAEYHYDEMKKVTYYVYEVTE